MSPAAVPPNNKAKNTWTFIGLVALVCAIPGIIYFSLNKTLGSYTGSDIPSGTPAQASQSLSTLQASNATVGATLRFTHPPVKMGETPWVLTLKTLATGQPITVTPQIKVVMPMNGHPMTAHTTFAPTRTLGEYKGQSDLSMGGAWTLEVYLPEAPQQKLALKFWVQES